MMAACGRRGVRDHFGRRKPALPTPARPGTEEKIAVMCERAARGEALFHDGDGKDAGTAASERMLRELFGFGAAWEERRYGDET